MLLKTRVFKLYQEKYRNLNDLARTMKISLDEIYGVYEGKYTINERFIVGAIKALPEYNISHLFYFTT